MSSLNLPTQKSNPIFGMVACLAASRRGVRSDQHPHLTPIPKIAFGGMQDALDDVRPIRDDFRSRWARRPFVILSGNVRFTVLIHDAKSSLGYAGTAGLVQPLVINFDTGIRTKDRFIFDWFFLQQNLLLHAYQID